MNTTLRLVKGLAVLVSFVGCSSSSTPAPTGDGGTTSAWRSAVGAGGLFARTFDDADWTARNLPAPTLYGVTCLGNEKAWVAGAGGYVAHTEDHGQTWAAQASGATADLHAVRFTSASSGVVAGDGGAIAVTSDGGAHWRAAGVSVNVSLRAAAASDTGALVVVGDRGTVLVSRDSGATWAARDIPGAGDLTGVAIDALASRLVVVDSASNVYESSTCGGDWGGAHPLPPPATPPTSVSISSDGRRVLIAGQGGALYVGNAGPATYTRATAPAQVASVGLNAALVDDTAGRMYAGGESGTLLTSADDGASWSVVRLETKSTIYALDDL